MQSGWIRAFLFVAAAALLGNTQCYGNCFSTACDSAQTPSDSCHHHPKPSHDDARCPYQHSEFATAEVGMAKISLATGTLAALAPAVNSIDALNLQLLTLPDTGPPPGSDSSSTFSVLRI